MTPEQETILEEIVYREAIQQANNAIQSGDEFEFLLMYGWNLNNINKRLGDT